MSTESSGISIDWSKIRAVIFDVDGTLYDQKGLRRAMLTELMFHYALRPWRWRDLAILQCFRSLREEMAGESRDDLEGALYAATALKQRVPESRVRKCVDTWIMTRPLRHLAKRRFAGLGAFCRALESHSIRLAAFSDYPSHAKLHSLGLPEMTAVCATDKGVGTLKPDPRGLEVLLEMLELSPASCVLIGDRDERDGECARRIGMPYLIRTDHPGRSTEFESYSKLCDQLESSFGRAGDS